MQQEQDANALIRDSVEAFEVAAAARHITIRAQNAKALLPARFDHDRLLQVLGNLLSNAIKFSQEGGEISLRAERVAGEVRFFVSDTGAGIAPDQLRSIFERFWQVTKDDRRGLGLGLFISRCIVEAHGGRIWAESKLGHGSTFCFTLPG